MSRGFDELASSAPEPELARAALDRVAGNDVAREVLARPEIAAPAALLLGMSRPAADFYHAHPEEIESLADLRPRSRTELLAEARGAVDAEGAGAGLRRFRRRAWLRVAARDLEGAPLEDVVGELSDVAEACLDVALGVCAAGDRSVGAGGEGSVEAVGGPAIVGMGKLGGRELNYASDVDVLFVHRDPGGPAQDQAVGVAARVIRLLAEPTSDGVVFRVDADLRPEGRAGPLSRSLAAMLDYYGRHAATWERQALVKARPVAGDPLLGRSFVEGVGPLVYPDALPATVLDDVRATKARIEETVRASGKATVEVKRGWGGIRDVEFAVQLLQLVHGRRHPALRAPGTLAALDALASEGFVAPADAAGLADSYRFLRRLEHRLQMLREVQTHELPSDRASLLAVARSMGFADPGRLLAEHARHTATVRGLHERLFYRPLLEAFAGPLGEAGESRADTEDLLAGLGFADPGLAYRSFAAVVVPSTRLGRVLGGLFPVVAKTVALADRPDAAALRLERVVDALRADPGLADRLADRLTDRPDAARRLVALVGASSAFADAIVARPSLSWGAFERPPVERSLFPGDPALDRMRVAAAFAADELDVASVGRRLSAAADASVAEALARAGPRVPMAVVAMGTFGAEELSFASDLDLLFVHDGDPSSVVAAASVAERTLAALREGGWVPDTDLRPEGRAGGLVRSLAAYHEYWGRWAESWEFQSLVRARFVAGDEDLGRRFLEGAAEVAFPAALSDDQVAAVRRMRVRIEEERVRPRGSRRVHFKLGHGSLADVQFAVELSLMRHGFAHPEVRWTNTLEAIDALVGAGLMDQAVGTPLARAHTFLSEIKAWLEIERRLGQGALPPVPEDQAALARRLGYEEAPRHRLMQEYLAVTRRARRAMETVFYGDEIA
jgi:glutamate-ammonia-ligase adenylyltransferase